MPQTQQQEIAPTDLNEVRSFDEIRDAMRAEENAEKQKVKNVTSRISNMATRSARLAGNAVESTTGVATRTLGSRIRMGLPMFVPLNLGDIVTKTENAAAEGRNAKVLTYTDEMISNMDELDAQRVIDAGLTSDPNSEIVKNLQARRDAGMDNRKAGIDRLHEYANNGEIPDPRYGKHPGAPRRIKELPAKPEPKVFDFSQSENTPASFEDMAAEVDSMFVDEVPETIEFGHDNRYAEFDSSTDDFVSEPGNPVVPHGIDRQAMADEIVAPVLQRQMEDRLLDKQMSDRLFGHGGAYM